MGSTIKFIKYGEILKILTVILLAYFLAVPAHAGSLADKLFELSDSAKEQSRILHERSEKALRKAKKEVSNSYQDYKSRKKLEVEQKKRKEKRINNAVNYYEKQINKKTVPRTIVKYADPCSSPNAICQTDSLNRKWCWFSGTSKALCSSPAQKKISKKVTKKRLKVSVRESLKKKQNKCRKKVYEEWAKNGAGNQEFASVSLTEALKVCDCD